MKSVIPLLILMSLWITEAVAQLSAPGPPIGLTATPGDRQFKLTWTHPSGISVDDIDGYQIFYYDSGGLRELLRSVAIISARPRILQQDCPVGWVRSDGFAGRNRRVLIYEVNLQREKSRLWDLLL